MHAIQSNYLTNRRGLLVRCCGQVCVNGEPVLTRSPLNPSGGGPSDYFDQGGGGAGSSPSKHPRLPPGGAIPLPAGEVGSQGSQSVNRLIIHPAIQPASQSASQPVSRPLHPATFCSRWSLRSTCLYYSFFISVNIYLRVSIACLSTHRSVYICIVVPSFSSLPVAVRFPSFLPSFLPSFRRSTWSGAAGTASAT